MKKIMFLVIATVLVTALFWSCQKQSDENKNNVSSKNAASEKAGGKDEEACEEARKENTRAAWERYLREFPAGKCAEKGTGVRNKFKKIGGFEWSNIFEIESVFHPIYPAEKYCDSLVEDGHSDWRLPNIDELRLLVQNHPDTVAGGKCRISEEHNKLDEKDYTDDCEGRKGSNFSKFGDKERLLSSSEGWWYINFDTGNLFQYEPYSELFVRCVRQDDSDACETAKKYNKFYYWQHYLENFPNGKCISEAKAFIEKEDKKVCEEARKENTRAGWERYLKRFPKGQCVEEGKASRNKFKKIGAFEWSDISVEPMSVDDMGRFEGDKESAESYCDNLEEDGHSDWRVPTIDELRVLVQNHSGTVAGGKCAISEEKDDRIDDESEGEDHSCEGIEGEDFSKLGDKENLWSSSLSETCRTSAYWSINFINGGILSNHLSDRLYVRCVRQDDNDACETARKEETDEAWKYYLSYFPEGKCAKEAKAGAKEDVICERAKKANTRATWEKYLKKFPKGKCAKEGNAVRNKFKRIGNYEWSDVIEDWTVSCESLEEDGHNDWREPNIDELRTLVQNHPGTVAGGSCKIYEKDSLGFGDELEKIDYEDEAKFNFKNCDGIEGDNFSKLRDKGWLDSSSVSGEGPICGVIEKIYFSISFDNGKLSPNGSFGRKRCVRQDDPDACETAKKYNTIYYWNFYIENFPKGKCAAEAKAFLRKDAAKDRAAKSQIDNSKKNGNSEWSNRSRKAMSWNQAKSYCENLKENGSSDWRLPTISELRTLVAECKSTETGGACGVTDTCLSKDSCKNDVCKGCGGKIQHSKFGDKGMFWSSSISPDNKNAWYIDFTYGSVHNHSNSEKFVRCVR